MPGTIMGWFILPERRLGYDAARRPDSGRGWRFLETAPGAIMEALTMGTANCTV